MHYHYTIEIQIPEQLKISLLKLLVQEQTSSVDGINVDGINIICAFVVNCYNNSSSSSSSTW